MNKTYLGLLLGMAASAGAAIDFYYNNAGYDVGGPASVVVKSTEELEGAEWMLFKVSTGGASSVKTGVFGKGKNPDNWLYSGKFYTVDLPNSLGEGTYYLSTTGGKPLSEGEQYNSRKFDISKNNLANKTLNMVLQYFRDDRSLETEHTSVNIFPYGGVGLDVHGGWRDASGDYGTYLSHLSYANYMNPQQIPLTVWALAFTNEHIPVAVKAAVTNENDFAVNEALWGADFLVRMQNNTGFFYMTVFNHWGSGSWNLCAFSGKDGDMSSDYQTAYREGGGMAIAALARTSTLGKDGDFSSADYLAAAKKGFEHLEEKQTLGGACAYCDNRMENIIDDYTALLAATELYNATKESSYWTVAQNRAAHLIGRLSDEGFFWSDNDKTRPFYHASDAGLPLVALVRYLEFEKDVAKAKAVRVAAKKHLDWMIKVTDRENNSFGYAKQVVKTGDVIQTNFFIPHDNETGYWWQGESARLGSLASAAVYASRMLDYADSAKAFQYAADQLDWILGKNPYDMIAMAGIGDNTAPVYNGNYETTYAGGIANGITGRNTDGSGISWNEASSWENWRWVEQWIPHSTWYLMALATRYDEHPVKGAADIPSSSSSSQGSVGSSSSSAGSNDGTNVTSSNSNSTGNSSSSKGKVRKKTDGLFQVATAAEFSVLQSGNALHVSFENPAQRDFHLMDVHGRVMMNATLLSASNKIQLTSVPKGIYLVHVQGFAPKKIVVK